MVSDRYNSVFPVENSNLLDIFILYRSTNFLLPTPTTDGEILLGKSIWILLPPVIAIWIGAVIFMGMIDYYLIGYLGYL